MSAPIGQRLSSALLQNLWFKVASLVFAVGLYAFMHSGQNAERTVKVAVIADMPPPDAKRILKDPIMDAVTVSLVGPRAALDTLHAEDIEAIKLNLRSGQSVPALELVPSMISGLPPRVRVSAITPRVLSIRFEDEITIDVPVQVAITGELAAGRELDGNPVVRPLMVKATGPASIVELLGQARADAFDVSNIEELGRHARRLALDRPPERVTYDVDSVEAVIQVVRKLATKTFTNVKVDVVGMPKAVTKPEFIDVTVVGAPEAVEALVASAMLPRVELDPEEHDLTKPGSALLDVKVEDIDDTNVEIRPRRVLVTWAARL